jgi:2-polyprenyl-3-methyl-5-hydroxy-6-metoxy-1,4-benzoquinol methylase
VFVDQQQAVRPATGLTHRIIADLGATMAAGAVVLGDRLGLYRALATGPLSPLELARRTGTAPRYVEEWLRGQAAAEYVAYDPASGAYWLTPEQAQVFTDPEAALNAPAAFQFALAALRAQARLETAFRTGEGIGWPEHDAEVRDAWARVQQSLYGRHLVRRWLPALRGVEAKLRRGAAIAEIACGHAVASTLMARAFPASRFTAFDHHPESVAVARARVADAGLADRVQVEQSWPHTFGGGPYDLVTTFDALHDQGDPVGIARRVAEQLAADGTWMIVEPFAGATVSENLTPTGRLHYAISIFLCVPSALAQEGGHSLGAQAGEGPIRRIAQAAGFGHVRRIAQTELSAVYEVRHA